MLRVLLYISASLLVFLSACKPDKAPDAPPLANDYVFKQPAGFPAPVYDFKSNTVTQAGFELGRKLFYDPALSKDSTISCGTCHKQYAAFSDVGHHISHGIQSRLGTRNSPALFNMAWSPTFFWDGGVTHLELQPLAPITNPVEMDETMAGVVTKISNIAAYRPMFKAAFGSDTVTTQAIMRSLAQFMGMMVSHQSKYDKVLRGEATFTPDEQAGYVLFKNNCAACHTEPLFTDFSFRNNGLDTAFTDEGRKHITLQNADLGKFKVPSLRNAAITFPYMHDGRIETLEDVMEHYTKGIKNSPTLDNVLKTPIVLTPTQKAQLILFIKTLTDNTFITDKRFSEPVK